jgi:hypothetical protein
MRRFGTWYRVAMGLLVLIALAAQYVHSHGNPGFSTVNYFSYFTNLSNIVGALLFIYCGLRGDVTSLAVDMLRGAATVYLATTGLVYNLLLTGEAVGVVIPWVNAVIHGLFPIVAVVDWLVFPPKHELRFNRTWIWVVFPFAYLAYTLIRGAATDWYPYPFLNPAKVHGYGGVAVYCVAIALALAALVWAVTWIGNRQRRAKA